MIHVNCSEEQLSTCLHQSAVNTQSHTRTHNMNTLIYHCRSLPVCINSHIAT